MQFDVPPITLSTADGVPQIELTLESGVVGVRLLAPGPAVFVDGEELRAAVDELFGG